MGGEELHGVTDSRSLGFWNVDLVAPVMLRGRSHVPSRLAMGGPGASLTRFFVGNTPGAQRCQWCCIEIVGSMDLLMGREVGVST